MQYNEKCPVCGTINKGLNLEETNGWFECEHCKNIVNTFQYSKYISRSCSTLKISA